MSVKWDEELVAGWEKFSHKCGDEECQDKQKIVRLARAEHTARLEAEGRASYRWYKKLGAERDALAEKVEAVKEYVHGPGPHRTATEVLIGVIRCLSDQEGR